MILLCHALRPEFSAPTLTSMLSYYVRNILEPTEPSFIISDSSVRSILTKYVKVWKMARPYRALIFTPSTAISSLQYDDDFQTLSELSGEAEFSNRIICAEKTTFSTTQISPMIWAEAGLPAL